MDPMDEVAFFKVVGGGIKVEDAPRASVVGFGAPDPFDLERASDAVEVELCRDGGRIRVDEGAGASGLLGIDPPLEDFVCPCCFCIFICCDCIGI